MDIGSVVTLRSGGPQMTVTEAPAEGSVVCTWFGGSKNSELRVGTMPRAALRETGGASNQLDLDKFTETFCSMFGDADGRRVDKRFRRLLACLDFPVRWAVVAFDRSNSPHITLGHHIDASDAVPTKSFEGRDMYGEILYPPGPKNPELWEQHAYPMVLTELGPNGESRHGMLRIWVAPEENEQAEILARFGITDRAVD